MTLPYEDILEKARRYCAYRERSSHEVKIKLREWKTSDDDAVRILRNLKDEAFVDDWRFAQAFVQGKFRIKKWGRMKIRVELRRMGIPDELAGHALAILEEDEYLEVLRSVIEKKKQTLSGQAPANIRQKVIRHALSKGFETDLIFKCL